MNLHNLGQTFGALFKSDESTPVPQRQGRRQQGTPEETARHSILVIDASPSMNAEDWEPSRLKAAQKAARAFVTRLAGEEPDARVSVIFYGGGANVVARAIPVTRQAELERCINAAKGSGGTNITAGLTRALSLTSNPSRLNQVVLLTDGHHNCGPGPRQISDQLRQEATLECIGIGGSPSDVDEALLKDIASSYPDGTKRYRWIGDEEKLVQHFHDLAGRITRA